jgi:hypothetical protein
MRKVKYALLLIIILALYNCENDGNYANNGELIGNYGNAVSADTVWIFERTSGLVANEYGFAFKPGNVFIERKNTGWCATPPIAYGDFEGTWHQEDSIINISVEFWGGTANLKWQIISLDKNKLTIYKVSEEYISRE